jgi:hypothetical protein
MITLFRLFRLWSLKVKWKLAVMQFINSELTKIAKNPEEIEKKILPYLSELIHNSVESEREAMKNK